MCSFREIAIDGFIWQREDGFGANSLQILIKYLLWRSELVLILLVNDDDALITNALIQSQNKNGKKYENASLDQPKYKRRQEHQHGGNIIKAGAMTMKI